MNELYGSRVYIKPTANVYEVEIKGLICASPLQSYYNGGGGIYDNESIWNNGDY